MCARAFVLLADLRMRSAIVAHSQGLIGVGHHLEKLIQKVPQHLLRQRANLAVDNLTVGDE